MGAKMKEKLKGSRLNITLSAIMSVIIGVFFVVFPESSIATIGKIIALVVILSGIVIIVSQVIDFSTNIMGIIVGGIIAVIGVWIFFSPEAIMTIVPIAIGVILCVHGLQDLKMSFESYGAGARRVWLSFLLSAFNIILGILCILHSFNFVKLTFIVIRRLQSVERRLALHPLNSVAISR